MQAITTKYLGPTNYRGSRIKATGWRGTITVDLDHSLPHGFESHKPAVDALIRQWFLEDQAARGETKAFEIKAVGALPTGEGYAFVVGYPAS